MQAAFQSGVDNAVSKTINLPTEASSEMVADVYPPGILPRPERHLSLSLWQPRRSGPPAWSGRGTLRKRTCLEVRPLSLQVVVLSIDWKLPSPRPILGTIHSSHCSAIRLLPGSSLPRRRPLWVCLPRAHGAACTGSRSAANHRGIQSSGGVESGPPLLSCYQ